jgi:membrane fusion protein, multidrug efflux system
MRPFRPLEIGSFMFRILRSRRTWILTVIVLAIAAFVVLSGRGEATKAAVKDKPIASLEFNSSDLTSITTRPVAHSLAVSGSLVAVNQAMVKAKVAVEVRSISVREGDKVTAGQVIATLDTVDLSTRLEQQIGAREAMRAQYEIAEKNRSTNASLLEKKFISQNAFDNVASLSSANRASLDAAEAQVRLAQKALRDATVVAPITGIVSRKNAQVGEKTSIDAPLFTIVDLDSIELQAIVPAGEVGELTTGMAATLTVDGMTDKTFDARINRINPATEPGTRSIVVFLTVPNSDHLLKSGMFANGNIRLAASAPRPTLPLGAIQSEAGVPVVWTIEQGKLTRRTVVLGARDDATGIVEIKSGVPPDTPVLASKFDNVKEGAPAIAKIDVKAVSQAAK